MVKKRFIAGAKCPHCEKVDTLRWWKELHIEVIECVMCGHQDRRSPEHAPNDQAPINDAQVIGIFKPQ